MSMKTELETRAATLAAEARLLGAVQAEATDVQLSALLFAYVSLAERHGLIEECGKQLLQVGASMVWREAYAKSAEQRPSNAALH